VSRKSHIKTANDQFSLVFVCFESFLRLTSLLVFLAVCVCCWKCTYMTTCCNVC